MAHQTHVHDGHVWTYASVNKLTEVFPYLTKDQIRYSIDKLLQDEVLITGNYNPRGYDRTKWYSFSVKFAKSIWENPQMEVVNSPTPIGAIPTPIPDRSTDTKADKELSAKADLTYSEFIEIYHLWFLDLHSVPPMINGVEGNAAKSLISYFKKIARSRTPDESPEDNCKSALKGFKVVLDNWYLLDKWLRTKYKLTEINSNINNIIPQIKKAYEVTTPKRPDDWRQIIREASGK